MAEQGGGGGRKRGFTAGTARAAAGQIPGAQQAREGAVPGVVVNVGLDSQQFFSDVQALQSWLDQNADRLGLLIPVEIGLDQATAQLPTLDQIARQFERTAERVQAANQKMAVDPRVAQARVGVASATEGVQTGQESLAATQLALGQVRSAIAELSTAPVKLNVANAEQQAERLKATIEGLKGAATLPGLSDQARSQIGSLVSGASIAERAATQYQDPHQRADLQAPGIRAAFGTQMVQVQQDAALVEQSLARQELALTAQVRTTQDLLRQEQIRLETATTLARVREADATLSALSAREAEASAARQAAAEQQLAAVEAERLQRQIAANGLPAEQGAAAIAAAGTASLAAQGGPAARGSFGATQAQTLALLDQYQTSHQAFEGFQRQAIGGSPGGDVAQMEQANLLLQQSAKLAGEYSEANLRNAETMREQVAIQTALNEGIAGEARLTEQVEQARRNTLQEMSVRAAQQSGIETEGPLGSRRQAAGVAPATSGTGPIVQTEVQAAILTQERSNIAGSMQLSGAVQKVQGAFQGATTAAKEWAGSLKQTAEGMVEVARGAGQAAEQTAAAANATTAHTGSQRGFAQQLQYTIGLWARYQIVGTIFSGVTGAIRGTEDVTRRAITANFELERSVGVAADSYIAFSDKVADANGRSRVSVEESTANMSRLTHQYGLSAQTIQQLVQASSDLARVNGKELAPTAAAVEHGIEGNSRALENYGVTISTRALRELGSLTAAQKTHLATMSAEELAQVRANAIIEQASVYHGAAADYATRQEGAYVRLSAASSNLAQSLGTFLAPVVFKISDYLAKAATAINDIGTNAGRFAQTQTREGQIETIIAGRGQAAAIPTRTFGLTDDQLAEIVTFLGGTPQGIGARPTTPEDIRAARQSVRPAAIARVAGVAGPMGPMGESTNAEQEALIRSAMEAQRAGKVLTEDQIAAIRTTYSDARQQQDTLAQQIGEQYERFHADAEKTLENSKLAFGPGSSFTAVPEPKPVPIPPVTTAELRERDKIAKMQETDPIEVMRLETEHLKQEASNRTKALTDSYKDQETAANNTFKAVEKGYEENLKTARLVATAEKEAAQKSLEDITRDVQAIREQQDRTTQDARTAEDARITAGRDARLRSLQTEHETAVAGFDAERLAAQRAGEAEMSAIQDREQAETSLHDGRMRQITDETAAQDKQIQAQLDLIDKQEQARSDQRQDTQERKAIGDAQRAITDISYRDTRDPKQAAQAARDEQQARERLQQTREAVSDTAHDREVRTERQTLQTRQQTLRDESAARTEAENKRHQQATQALADERQESQATTQAHLDSIQKRREAEDASYSARRDQLQAIFDLETTLIQRRRELEDRERQDARKKQDQDLQDQRTAIDRRYEAEIDAATAAHDEGLRLSQEVHDKVIQDLQDQTRATQEELTAQTRILQDELQNRIDAINKALKPLQAAAQFIGGSFGEGMQHGIEVSQAGVNEAATAAGNEAADSTAQAIGSQSPSTRLAKTGRDFSHGLAKGIGEGSTAAVSAAQQVADLAAMKVQAGATTSLSEIDSLLAQLHQRRDTITGASGGSTAQGPSASQGIPEPTVMYGGGFGAVSAGGSQYNLVSVPELLSSVTGKPIDMTGSPTERAITYYNNQQIATKPAPSTIGPDADIYAFWLGRRRLGERGFVPDAAQQRWLDEYSRHQSEAQRNRIQQQAISPGTNIDWSLSGDFGRMAYQYRASGGQVLPGRRYVVGERGPETLDIGMAGGYVESAPGGLTDSDVAGYTAGRRGEGASMLHNVGPDQLGQVFDKSLSRHREALSALLPSPNVVVQGGDPAAAMRRALAATIISRGG